MTICAHLEVESIACPGCGASIPIPLGKLLFQWGYCPARHVVPEPAYGWGDPIRWRSDDEGRIPSWAYFEGVDQGGGNVGDPQFQNVRVRVFTLEWHDVGCDACGASGVDVQIERGLLTKAVAATPGSELSQVEQDGRITARPDWDAHPMSTCLVERRRRLVVPDAVHRHGRR